MSKIIWRKEVLFLSLILGMAPSCSAVKFDGASKKSKDARNSSNAEGAATSLDQQSLSSKDVADFKATSFQSYLDILLQSSPSNLGGTSSKSSLSQEERDELANQAVELDMRYGNLGGYFAEHDIPVLTRTSTSSIEAAIADYKTQNKSASFDEDAGSADISSSEVDSSSAWGLRELAPYDPSLPSNVSSCADRGYHATEQPDIIQHAPVCLEALRQSNPLREQDRSLCEMTTKLTFEEATKDVTNLNSCEGPQVVLCSYDINGTLSRGYKPGQCDQLAQSPNARKITTP